MNPSHLSSFTLTPIGPPTYAELLDIAIDHFHHWCWQHGLQDDPPDFDEDRWIASANASLCAQVAQAAFPVEWAEAAE